MSAVERAAEVLRENVSFFQYYGPEARDVAQALADAGLLAVDWDEKLAEYGITPMTEEEIAEAAEHAHKHFGLQRAVIETAKACRRFLVAAKGSKASAPTEALTAAVDALLEAEAQT